ncbi:RNA polymerase sigma factor [Parabacteroides pacaensis]|uniref:RNA polymerase sigma factor n=1 Tax=Parabacteroides pacaensis TaxID=2086575 RepID=UPI000D11351D|nr:RNA polymerase sigma factor [Parabacteroides pacaensis]
MDETTTYLIEGCRKRNRSAQLALYKQHARRLYAACYRIIGNAPEAEEAMQDAFLKVFTRIDQYRNGLCFEAWMQRIAIHTAIDYVRKQTPELEELTEKYTNIEDEETDDENIQYSVQKIKEGMQLLPAGYRVILSLYLFEGYDMEEISSILNVKQVTVRTQYLRAKKKLLELISYG